MASSDNLSTASFFMASPHIKERHVDRLLAEEVEASSDFARWFAIRAGIRDIPTEGPVDRRAAIGFYRANGETDIRMELVWAGGRRVVVHVEDKVLAVPQPMQAERYAEAVDKEVEGEVASVLFAPRAWCRRHPDQAGKYGAVVEFEMVAEWFLQRSQELVAVGGGHAQELANRLSWRAQILSGEAGRRAVRDALAAGDLNDWNAIAAEVIYSRNGLVLGVRQRQRTMGAAKQTRFMMFDEALQPAANGEVVVMKLKTGGQGRPGRVSLEITRGGTGGEAASAEGAGLDVERSRSARSLIVSASGPLVERLNILESAADQVAALEEAADVAQRLVEWWHSRQS